MLFHHKQHSFVGAVLPSRSTLWRWAGMLLFTGILIIAGCGGGTNRSTLASTGSTQIRIGDAPADSIVALELTITQIVLTNQSGGTVTVLSQPTEIELSHLAGKMELLTLSMVPDGTYTQASISYSGAEVTYIPTGSTAPVEKKLQASGTAKVTLNNGQGISIGSSSVVNFDLNAAQSVTFDTTGNVTGINPLFTASVSAVVAEDRQEDDSGEVEDVVGTVSAPPANSAFVLAMQMAGQSATFNVNSSTQYSDGLNTFNDIKQGMLLKVDGVTQPDGSLLAKEVELAEDQGLEAEGIIVSATNPLTQFTIVDTDGAGSGISPANLGSTINVTVDPNTTTFRANLDHIDMSGLSFTFNNPANVAKGQNVEVESAAGMQANNTVNAGKVVLEKQALTGTVSNYASNGSSATFTLNLSSESAFFKLTGVNAIKVYQQQATELKGLTGVSNGATVRVRGLLFFDGTNYQFVAARIALP